MPSELTAVRGPARSALLATVFAGLALLFLAPFAAASERPTTAAASVLPAAGLTALAAPRVDVVDDAGVLTSADVTVLRQSAARITSAQRVVVYTTTSSDSDLTNHLARAGSQVGWSNGAPAPGTLVVTVAPDARNMDLSFGDGLTSLQNYQEQLYDAMTARFRSSDWAGGLNAALIVAQEALTGRLEPDQDPASGDSSPISGWLVAGVGGAGLVGYSGLKSFNRRRKEKQDLAAAKRAADEQAAANTSVILALRARLEQDRLLVPSIADSPLQDQLELDLTTAEADLRTADSEANPMSAAAELTALTAAVDSLDRRITLLRKDSGWEVAWSGEVDAVRKTHQEAADLVARIPTLGGAAAALPDITGQLTELENAVRTQASTIEVGLGQLVSLAHDATARRNQAAEQVQHLEAAIEAERRRKQAEQDRLEAQRRREQELAEEQEYEDGGLWGGGSSWSRGRSRSRSRGGGWGSGWGGGWTRGGSSRSRGSSRSGSTGSRSSSTGRRGGGGTRGF